MVIFHSYVKLPEGTEIDKEIAQNIMVLEGSTQRNAGPPTRGVDHRCGDTVWKPWQKPIHRNLLHQGASKSLSQCPGFRDSFAHQIHDHVDIL